MLSENEKFVSTKAKIKRRGNKLLDLKQYSNVDFSFEQIK